MMEYIMTETRTVQFFLSENLNPGGIYEVSIDKDKNFYCTCPGFTGRSTCKHTKFVLDKVKKNNGSYPLEISSKVSNNDIDAATDSLDGFREFILKYGKIEVC
jgi:hypothetical protein